MKKRLLISLISTACAVSCAFGLAACGGDDNSGHTGHDYAAKYTSDSEYHWRPCTGCSDKLDYSKHVSSDGLTCSVCGYEFQDVATGDGAFNNVAVAANGVLSWNKIKGASKYVLKVTYASESDSTEYAIDKSKTSANLNELRGEGFPSGKSSVELLAYENVKVEINGQTEYQEIPMTDVKETFNIVKSNGNFSLVRLSYADANIRLDGFYADKRTVGDKSVYLYEQVLKDNKPMTFKINSIVKATNNHAVQYYKSESGRNAGDAADVWNSFELQMGYPQLQHGANFYYVRVTDNATGDTQDYDLCVYGVYSITVKRYDTSFDLWNGLRTYTHTPIGNDIIINELDILPQDVLYSGVGEGKIARSADYEVLEKEDITMIADSIEVKYYFYDEATVRADCQTYEEWSKTYYLNEHDNGWSISCKQSITGIVTLPDILIGKKVIAADFSYCSISGLVVEEGAQTLAATFTDCFGLLDIFLPSTITEMRKNSFAGVNTEVTVYCAFSSATASDFTLYWDYGINKKVKTEYGVTVPAGAVAIKDGLVYAATDSEDELSVASVLGSFDGTIPTTVTYDGKTYNVTGIDGIGELQTITIGENIKTIAEGALAGVQQVTVSAQSQYFTVRDNLLCSKDYTRLLRIADKSVGTDITALTISDTVQTIDFGALAEFTSLQSLTLPFVGASATASKNTYLGYIFGARSATDNFSCVPATLQSVVITGGKAIGDFAFDNCTGISSITLPDSVTTIERFAFNGCMALTDITIPDNVTFVGLKAFSGTAWYNSQPDGLVYVGKVAYTYKGSMPNNTSITVADGIKTIADFAFDGCTGLVSITVPSSVTYIGSSAFNGCTGLTSITLPDSVTYIGGGAFYSCTALTSITIPNSVTYIGGSVFGGCTNLSSITIPFIGSSATDTKNTELCYFFGVNLNSIIPAALKTVVVTGGTTIAESAFSECHNITSVTISDSVKSISRFAFFRCGELTSVTIGSGVTFIDESAFRECYNLTDITFNGTKAQWNAIDKYTTGNGFPWDHSTGNYTVHCTDGDISKSAK